MDTNRFDRLVQVLAGSGNRRGLLRLLALLPVSGGASSVLAMDSEAARHHRRTQHHRNDHQQLHEQRKKKKKTCAQAGQATSKKRKTCCAGLVRDGNGLCSSATPSSPPTSLPSPPPSPGCTPLTCAPDACGTVPDGCGGTLSCGGCAGNAICASGTCQPCDVCPSGCLFTTVGEAMGSASSGETIHLCPGLYVGDIDITKNLTLTGAGDGNGAGSTILRGTGIRSVVEIEPGHIVRLQRLRVTGGNSNFGGGITNQGALTLSGCTITGNTGNSGGGLAHTGDTLTLTNCTVAENSAFEGGGIFVNTGTLTLVTSTISGNIASEAGGGIANGRGSKVTLDAASRISGNRASLTDPGSGGGIANLGGTVTLSSADNVSGNTPGNCGGPTPVPLCNG